MNHRSNAPTLSLTALVAAHSLLMPACGASSNDGMASGGAANGGASQPNSSGGLVSGGSAARGGSGGNVSAEAGRAGASSAGRDGTGGVPGSAGEGGARSTGGEQTEPGAGGDSGAAGGGGAAGSSGEGGEGGAPDGVPSIATIMAEYRSYQPQTAQPVPVSAYIFGLCRLPTLKEQTFADSEHGNGRYLQDWANESAVSGIARRGQPPFAVGSVIVKEKYVPGAISGSFDLAALGFMIKREPGFAPANGDWDYAYWEPELGVLSSAEQSSYCGSCHAGAASTDFVFVDGLMP